MGTVMTADEMIRIVIEIIARKMAIISKTKQNWPIQIFYEEDVKKYGIGECDLDCTMEKLCKEYGILLVTNRPHRMAWRLWDYNGDSTLVGPDMGCYNVWAGDPFNEFRAKMLAEQHEIPQAEQEMAGNPQSGEDEGQKAGAEEPQRDQERAEQPSATEGKKPNAGPFEEKLAHEEKQIGQGTATQAEKPKRERVFSRSKIAKSLGLTYSRAGETLRKTLEPAGFPVHFDDRKNRWNYRDEINSWKTVHAADIAVLNERNRKKKKQA